METVEPATLIGCITANGVTLPVLPTLTSMSSNFVRTTSGGYLYATAHLGVLDVAPRFFCVFMSFTFTTTPSIS